MTVSGQFSCPPAGSPVAVSGQSLVAADTQVTRYRREGLLGTLDGYPSCSRCEVEAILADPWLTGTRAAHVLGVSRTRVSQLANADRIPVHIARSGKRYYRLE